MRGTARSKRVGLEIGRRALSNAFLVGVSAAGSSSTLIGPARADEAMMIAVADVIINFFFILLFIGLSGERDSK